MYMRELSHEVINRFDDPVARTAQGLLRGIKVEDTYIFRGVKYADARRFRLPTEPAPWDGIRRAEIFGTVCPTMNIPYVPDMFRVPHFFYPENEDCQYLNIWTRSLDSSAKRPVMVWIHGGAWFSGHSMEVYSYDGENLAHDKNVVVVSLNHRLNIYGCLDLSGYGEEYRYSGMTGMADIVAALEWIRKNISAFGGDPDCVTIFGQSSGGGKVVSLMQMPSADGLYHRAVIESGGMSAPKETNEMIKSRAKELADIVVSRLGLTKDSISRIDTVDRYDLQTAAAEALWIYKERHHKPYSFAPVPDGEFFFGHPLQVGFRSETAGIPMMVGHCYGENCNNYDFQYGEGHKNRWSPQYAEAAVRQYLGSAADECIAAFREAYPEKKLQDIIFMNRAMRRASIEFCKKRAEFATAPVYNWMFNLEAPFMDGTVAWHNAEEPYVFRNASYTEAQYEPIVSERVEDQVSGAWAAFAEKGDPNCEFIPVWQPVQESTVPTMLFDRETRLGTNHDEALLNVYTIPDARSVHTEFNAAITGMKPRG